MAKHRAELSASPSLVPLPRKPRSELLTVDQAAERLNVPVGYVRRRLIFERRIPFVKIGHHVRIESAVVDALIEAGRVEPQLVARASGRPRPSVEETRKEELARWSHIRKHPVTSRPQVRWRDRSGRERSKTFARATDARAYKAMIEHEASRGELGTEASENPACRGGVGMARGQGFGEALVVGAR